MGFREPVASVVEHRLINQPVISFRGLQSTAFGPGPNHSRIRFNVVNTAGRSTTDEDDMIREDACYTIIT